MAQSEDEVEGNYYENGKEYQISKLDNNEVNQSAASFQKLMEELRDEIRSSVSKANKDISAEDNSTSKKTEFLESQMKVMLDMTIKVKNQEMELENLKKCLNNNELAEARLKSQETFWQAKLSNQVEMYKSELEIIYKEIENLKGVTEGVTTSNMIIQVPETKSSEKVDKAVEITPDTKSLIETGFQPTNPPPMKPKPTVGNEDAVLPKQLSGTMKFQEYENFIHPAKSNLKDNEYASIKSLLETIEKSPMIEDLVEENPSFLKRFRVRTKIDLEEKLQDLDIESEILKIDDRELTSALAKLKESRKSIKNGKQFSSLRQKCKQELNQVIKQADIENSNSTLDLKLGTRMASMRQKILKTWRRTFRNERRQFEGPPNDFESSEKKLKHQDIIPTVSAPNIYVKLAPNQEPQKTSTELEQNAKDQINVIGVPQPMPRKSKPVPSYGGKEILLSAHSSKSYSKEEVIPWNKSEIESNLEHESEETSEEESETDQRDAHTEDEQSSQWDSDSSSLPSRYYEEEEVEDKVTALVDVHHDQDESQEKDFKSLKLKQPPKDSNVYNLKNKIEAQLKAKSGKIPPSGGISTCPTQYFDDLRTRNDQDEEELQVQYKERVTIDDLETDFDSILESSEAPTFKKPNQNKDHDSATNPIKRPKPVRLNSWDIESE